MNGLPLYSSRLSSLWLELELELLELKEATELKPDFELDKLSNILKLDIFSATIS